MGEGGKWGPILRKFRPLRKESEIISKAVKNTFLKKTRRVQDQSPDSILVGQTQLGQWRPHLGHKATGEFSDARVDGGLPQATALE